MNKQELNKAKTEIKRLWSKINYIIDNKSMSRYGTELLNISMQESKDHDRFRGQSINRGISVKEEAKYFALMRVLKYVFTDEQPPSLDDFIHMQKSIFYAYSVAFEFQTQIKEVITQTEADYILSLDYCKLIEVE